MPKKFVYPLLLTIIVFTLLCITVAPDLYSLDSAEFVTAGYSLGFTHSPGYPLYTILLNLIFQLQLGSPAVVGNYTSLLAITLSTPLLYFGLYELTKQPFVSALATFLTITSYRIWVIGLFTEIYAPQILVMIICANCLLQLAKAHNENKNVQLWLILSAASFGFASAMHPTLLLLSFGMLTLFLQLPISWWDRVKSGFISILIFALPYLYFPIRQSYSDAVSFNILGQYDTYGVFSPINLQSLEGLWWLISGRQFGSLFFSEGIFPSIGQITAFFQLFIQNYTGFGIIFVIHGLVFLAKNNRKLFAIWLVFFIPFTYFYLTYGATDKELMFGPTFVMLSVPLAFSLNYILNTNSRIIRYGIVIISICITIVNIPLLDQSQEYDTRLRTDYFLEVAPQNAIILGAWYDISPLEYVHIVEKKREDLSLYNTFLFEDVETIQDFIYNLLEQEQTVWIIDQGFAIDFYEPFYVNRYIVEDATINFSPFTIYKLEGIRP